MEAGGGRRRCFLPAGPAEAPSAGVRTRRGRSGSLSFLRLRGGRPRGAGAGSPPPAPKPLVSAAPQPDFLTSTRREGQ